MKFPRWKMQEAKNRFREVICKAVEEGPQTITKHGKEIVIALSVEDYKKAEQPETNLVEFFRRSPLADARLNFDRDKSSARNIF